MIYIITGKTGHGKTAYMTRWIRDVLKRGGRAYVNYKINLKEMGLSDDIAGNIKNIDDRNNLKKRLLYWVDYQDWFEMKKGYVFCDEGIIYFNARLWEQLPHEIQIKFVQHRKDSLDLVVNVQHYTFIDKTLRVLAERYINLALFLGSPKFKKSIIPRVAKVVEYDLPTLNRCEMLNIDPFDTSSEEAQKYNIIPLYTEYFWIRSKIFSWYDTSQQVLESVPAPLRHILRVCPDCGHESVRHS